LLPDCLASFPKLWILAALLLRGKGPVNIGESFESANFAAGGLVGAKSLSRAFSAPPTETPTGYPARTRRHFSASRSRPRTLFFSTFSRAVSTPDLFVIRRWFQAGYDYFAWLPRFWTDEKNLLSKARSFSSDPHVVRGGSTLNGEEWGINYYDLLIRPELASGARPLLWPPPGTTEGFSDLRLNGKWMAY